MNQATSRLLTTSGSRDRLHSEVQAIIYKFVFCGCHYMTYLPCIILLIRTSSTDHNNAIQLYPLDKSLQKSRIFDFFFVLRSICTIFVTALTRAEAVSGSWWRGKVIFNIRKSVYLRFVLDVSESSKFKSLSKTNAAVDAYAVCW